MLKFVHPNEIEDKTIDRVDYSSYELIITFTDKTYTRLVSSEDDGCGYIFPEELNKHRNLSISDVTLGFVTMEKYEAERKRRKEIEEKENRERDLEQFNILKRKLNK